VWGRKVIVKPGAHFDAEENVTLGDRVYVNREVIFEGRGKVYIGAGAQIGPRCMFLTTLHPLNAAERAVRGAARTFYRDVFVGERVWLGAGVIVLPGVTIGPRTVVGAGSVVTRDLPPDVFAAGNPARIVREIAT
jgi:maltose O-acetyltransferase